MAIQLTRGEPLVAWLTYLNTDETPNTGRTFTVQVAERSDGTSFAADVTYSEPEAGMYRFEAATAPDDPAGEWYLVVISDEGARFEETFDVLATPPLQIVAHPTGRQAGTSRAELRRMIASRIGDLILVRATEGSTNSQVISHRDLIRPNHSLKGMDIICTSGNLANVGQSGVITQSDGDARAVTFAPPLPANTTAGDTFELYNRRGTGWKIEQYNFAINHALRQAGEDHATERVIHEPEGIYRRGDYVPLPDDWSRFARVEIVDRRGGRQKVPPTGWDIDTTSREIWLKRGWEHKAHGRTLRLHGHRTPAQLFGDADRTTMSTEWLVHEALNHLYQQGASDPLGTNDMSRLLFMERQGADGRRTSVLTVYEPNTVALE